MFSLYSAHKTSQFIKYFQVAVLLGMCEELVKGMLVVLQAGHGHQEAFDHLPGLSSIIRLSIGTLQAIQRSLNSLNTSEKLLNIYKANMPILRVNDML